MSAPSSSFAASAVIDGVLARLDGVQKSGRGYRARCPACGGRSRKVSITEADDGRVLLHCFGGCDAGAVVQAAGLTLGDLFPVRLQPETPEERRAWRRAAKEAQWGAALDILYLEATIVGIAARQLHSGEPLTPEDHHRLSQSIDRIEGAKGVLRAR